MKETLIAEVKKVNLNNISDDNKNYPKKLYKFLKLLTTRPVNLKRVSIFSLNYDMLLEEAFENAGILYNNGFSGIVNRFFSIENYDYDLYYPEHSSLGKINKVDKLINFYKLHGSISWFKKITESGAYEISERNPASINGDLIEKHINESQKREMLDNVLIYPTPLKTEETLDYPYSELFRRFYQTICCQQTVLFVIGYSFRDEHVNRIITRALSIPSFHLYIVDPYICKKSDNDNDQIAMDCEFIESLREDPRVTILAGTFEDFIDFLPDLRNENITEIIDKTVTKLNTLKKCN